MRPFHRNLILASAVLIAVTIGAVVTVGWIFYGTLPATSGLVEVPGLSAKVRVYRDAHGVPHIFAKTMDDAARALGYVHASDRLFQMEMQRRAGQGRLSEVAGPSMIGVDKFIRTLGLYPLSQSSFDALSPEARDYFTAYAGGVNEWIDQHRFSLPPEFALLGFRPEPWVPADSLLWGKLMALQLSHNYKLEILRATLAKKLSPSQMRALFPPYGGAPVTVPKEEGGKQKAENRALGIDPDSSGGLGQWTSLDHAASNEWAISGARTDTGKPILANDPHLSLGIPILWYLARIVTPDLTVAGATVPGLPVVLLGQNNAIAWGMTTTGSDVQDLFVETVDPKDPLRYLIPKGAAPFETRTEVIHVKGLQDVTIHVRATRHGPVLSDIDQELGALAGKGKVMALAFTGLGAQDTTAEALMRINRVMSWPDFLAALNLYQAPPQNVAFADVKGDIGFINPGLLPLRKKGNGLTPVDGASGAYDWVGTVPFEQLPRLYNPAPGVIFNANNALVPADSKPYLGVDWEEPYRAKRLQEFFTNNQRQTMDMSADLQADHVSMAARQLLPYLLRQKPENPFARSALERLRGWDGTMDKDRAEPLIFEAWLYEMHHLLFADRLGSVVRGRGPYAATGIAAILAHNGSNWCATKSCDDVIMKALDQALAMLTQRNGADIDQWRWGSEHRALLKNKVFTHIPWLRDRADIDLPSSGDFYTLDRGGSFDFDPDHPFARAHGGGYRAVYDLDDPARSRFMITTGESGHLFSPHYRDLAPLWINVQYINLTGTAAEFDKQGIPHLTLKP